MRRFPRPGSDRFLAGAGLLLLGLLLWSALPDRRKEPAKSALPWGGHPPDEPALRLPGAPPARPVSGLQKPLRAPADVEARPTLSQRLKALLGAPPPRPKAPPQRRSQDYRELTDGELAAALAEGKADKEGRGVFQKESLEGLGGASYAAGAALGGGAGAAAVPKTAEAGPRAFFVSDGVRSKDVSQAEVRLKAADRRGGVGTRAMGFLRRAAERPSPRLAASSSSGGEAEAGGLPGGGAGEGQTPGYAAAPQGRTDALPQKPAGLGAAAQGGGLGVPAAAQAAAGAGGGAAGSAGEDAWSWPGASEAGATAVLYQNALKTDYLRPLTALARRMGEEYRPRLSSACGLLGGVYDPVRLDRDIAWLAAELPGSELEDDLRGLRREGQDPENTLIRMAEAKDVLDEKLACLSEEHADALDCFAQVRDALVSRRDFAGWASDAHRDILLPHYNDARSDLSLRCAAGEEAACRARTRLEDAQEGLRYYPEGVRAAYDQLKLSAWGALGDEGRAEALRLVRYGVDQNTGMAAWSSSYGRLQRGEDAFTERERLVWRTPHCLDRRFQPLLGDYVGALDTSAAALERVPRVSDPDEKTRLLFEGARDSVGAYWYLTGCVQLLRAVDCAEVEAVQARLDEARTQLGLR